MLEHFHGDWAYTEPIFLVSYQKNFLPKIFTLFLLDGFLDSFSKFWLFLVKICILIWYFWIIFENYSMCMLTWKLFYHTLSIWVNDFIAHWAYEERNFAHAQPAVNCEQFLHVHRTLSIRETNFIAGWEYTEWILSLAEHTRKCLKVEYLGRIEYNFQKSYVIGSWDHEVSVSAKK